MTSLEWKVGMPNMGGSENNGTPKSSILVGFSIINHPFWSTPIFGNTHIVDHSQKVVVYIGVALIFGTFSEFW